MEEDKKERYYPMLDKKHIQEVEKKLGGKSFFQQKAKIEKVDRKDIRKKLIDAINNGTNVKVRL